MANDQVSRKQRNWTDWLADYRNELGRDLAWQEGAAFKAGFEAACSQTVAPGASIFKPFRGDGTGGELEAIESVLRFVDEHVSTRKCDAEAVSECVRCTTVYLAKIVKQLKAAPPAVSTPRCRHCGKPTLKIVWEAHAVFCSTCDFATPFGTKYPETDLATFAAQFFQPDSQPSPRHADEEGWCLNQDGSPKLSCKLCYPAQQSPEGERKP